MNVHHLPDALRVRAQMMGDAIAHDDTCRAITFREWNDEADAIAGGLAAAGLETGDRVFLPISNANAVDMAIAVFAVLRAGGVAVPINVRFSKTEIADYAALIEPRFAIHNSLQAVDSLQLERCWPVTDMPRNLSALPDQAAIALTDIAEILATSGTTGKIKGVVVTHADLLGTVTGTEIGNSRATLHALPFTGSGGNLGTLMLPIKTGATCITQPKFDPAAFMALAQSKRPQTVYLVPSMLRLIIDLPNIRDFDFSSVKWLMCGTAPLPQDSVLRALELWPHIRMRNSYGMSEGSFGIVTRSNAAALKPGCVGYADPKLVEIRDENGAALPRGVTGEVYGYTKHSRRYWRDEDATKQSFKDSWTKTGDLGYIDEDGDLVLCGRSKELIIRGGYNITPIEIETVLHDHPKVKDAAVVGVTHDILGEDVAAAVVLRHGQSATIDELLQWCRNRLADNKVPRTMIILSELPLNPSGKVLKRELQPVLQAASDEARKARAGG
nr:class I adenylate-forming enzyme family protein [Sphingomonas sp. CDS-1]